MPHRKIALQAAVALLIVTASFIPRPVRASEDYTSPRNADISATGAVSIHIEAASGILKVQGRSGTGQVQVRGTARSKRKSRLDQMRLVAERRGNVIFIKADMPKEGGSGFLGLVRGDNDHDALDLIIEVPNSIPLKVTDRSGAAEFNGTGPLDIVDGSGELSISAIHGDLKVKDGSGTITIDGVAGHVAIDDGSGHINAKNITGNFSIGTDGSGDIVVAGVGGTVHVASDGSGNIDVDRVAGDFVVDKDNSGSIRYRTVKGSVRIPERKRRG